MVLNLLDKKTQSKVENLIYDFLPANPYCTDYLEYGVKTLPKNIAVKKRYIQYNGTNIAVLIHDIDRMIDLVEIRNNTHLPTPNIVSINRINGHGHFYLLLAKPVYQANFVQKNSKAFNYCAGIDIGLSYRFEADFAFNKFISKNIFNDFWITHFIHDNLYDLDTLADYCDSTYLKKPKASESIGYGRNMAIFDSTRKFAYKEYRNFNYTQNTIFENNVLQFALQRNLEFITQLHFSEVKATVKSIIGYCYKNLTKQGMVSYANKNRLKGLIDRQKNAEVKENEVLQFKYENQTASNRVIANSLGYSSSAVDNIMLNQACFKTKADLRKEKIEKVKAYKKENPKASNRVIAKVLGYSSKTVDRILNNQTCDKTKTDLRKEKIEKVIAYKIENPKASNRTIAKVLGYSYRTVDKILNNQTCDKTKADLRKEKIEKVKAYKKENPKASNRTIAKVLGYSYRTVDRILNNQTK